MKKILVLLLFISGLVKSQVVIPKSTTTFSNVLATGNLTVNGTSLLKGTVTASGNINVGGSGTFTGSLSAQSLSSNGTYNYNRNYLKDWDAQTAKIQQATSNSTASIVWIGDSWTYNGTISQPVAAFLRNNFGDGGVGFYGVNALNNGSTYGSGGLLNAVRTKVGSWTGIGQNTYVMSPTCVADSSSTVNDSIYFVGVATDFIVHYMKKASGGSFVVRVDGTSPTTVTTSGTTSWSVTSKTGLSNAQHTLSVKVSSAGSGVIISGVEINKNQNGVRVHNLGTSGGKTADFVNQDSTNWCSAISSFTPNVAIICLGTNDCTQGVTPATYIGNITRIVNRVLSVAPNCDIVLFSGADIGNVTTYPISSYVTQLKNYALAHNYGFIDNYSLLGPYATGNARGLYSSTNHINAAGGGILQNNFINYLIPTKYYSNLNASSINIGQATTSNTTSLGCVRIAQGTSWLDIGQNSAGIMGFWMNQSATNSSTNYSLLGDATVTYLNAPSALSFRTVGLSRGVWNSTGLRVGSGTVASATLDVTGTMSVSSTSTLQTTKINHIIGGTSAPTVTLSTGAGTGATYTLATNSTDLAGQIVITAAGTPAANATIATLTFNTAYSVAPIVILTPANSNAASLGTTTQVYATSTTTTFLIKSNPSTGLSTGDYAWNWIIIQ